MLEAIIATVRAAGKIVLNAHNIQDGIENKQGTANFVTKYDIEVQEFLYRELAVLCPDAGFIGEEDENSGSVTNEYCFIIDPIDGTTNFIFDYKYSAISVGVLHHGQILYGVVYNPYLDEMFYAKKGMGAFLNGRQLTINNLNLSDGLVGIGTSPYLREKAEETFLLTKKLYDRSLDIRRSGSAALDLCCVAASRYVLFFEQLLQPWDYAAASLIISEAGGCITTMDGLELPYITACPVVAATPNAYEEFFHI